MRYWAVKLTAAAAAARTHRPAAALRSHRPDGFWPGPSHPGPLPGSCGMDGPAGPASASGMLGIAGWPNQITDVVRAVAVMERPFLQEGKANAAWVAGCGNLAEMAALGI